MHTDLSNLVTHNSRRLIYIKSIQNPTIYHRYLYNIKLSFFIRQALFVVSVLTAKPVFVNRVWLRVFHKNIDFKIFFLILKMKLYSVKCIKYFYLGILKHNCDFVGPFNLTISCIKLKFWVFEFLNFLKFFWWYLLISKSDWANSFTSHKILWCSSGYIIIHKIKTSKFDFTTGYGKM